jgi:hypothetical protein
MPYFFIFPLFVLYFLAMCAAIGITLLYRPAAPLRRYISSVLVWSSLGFVLSTAVYIFLLLASLLAVRQIADGQPSVVGGVMLGGVVFLAPFVAAAAGVMGGGLFGAWRCWRRSGTASNR